MKKNNVIFFNTLFLGIFFYFLFLLLAKTSLAGESSNNALNKLKEVQEAIEQNKTRSNQLNKVKKELNLDINELKRTLLETSLRVMGKEQIVNNISKKLKYYNSEEQAITQNLINKKHEIDKILLTLQRIQRYQLTSFQIREDEISKDIKTSHLLSAILPQINLYTKKLETELMALKKLRKEVLKQKKNLSSAKELMSREKIALNRLIDRKSDLRGKLIIETNENNIKIKKLAKNAKNLRTLIKKIDENKNFLTDKKTFDNKLYKNKFISSKGKLPLPVNGKLKTSFGEIGKLGAKSKGIVIETIPKASVISPYEGEIVFAAPFRNYGNLLIISYGNGYHILLSGMESIDGNVGKWIMAGEPVGKMGKIKRDETPELYMELRKNGEPINPKKWIAFNHMKVRG